MSPGTMVQLTASRPTPSMIWTRYQPLKKREYMYLDQMIHDPLESLRERVDVPSSPMIYLQEAPYEPVMYVIHRG